MNWLRQLFNAFLNLFRAPVPNDYVPDVDLPPDCPGISLRVPEEEYIDSMAMDAYWGQFYDEPEKYFEASARVYDLLREGTFAENVAFALSREMGRDAADHLLEVTVYSMCTEYAKEVEIYLRSRHM